MGPKYLRITENDGLLEKVGANLFLFLCFSDIVYRSTSNTILFSRINTFFTFVKFLNYFRLALTSVRTGHLQHTLNRRLHEKYCTGMYSAEELKQCVLARVEINQFVKPD
jgi:hypothetical protein